MYRIAYHLLGVSAKVAKESPAFKRLRQQCPDGVNGKWTCFEHLTGGTMAIWPSAGASFTLEEFGEPRETADGLTYYPSKEDPEMLDLLKPELARPNDGEWVTTSNGDELWIATAIMSERKWILSATGATRIAPMRHRYGILSRQLFAMCTGPKEEANPDEQAALEIKLIIAAIHASYDVTDEMIEDLPALHLSDVDIAVIRGVAWGLSPKESAAALVASRSSTQADELQTLALPPQKPQPSPDGVPSPIPPLS